MVITDKTWVIDPFYVSTNGVAAVCDTLTNYAIPLSIASNGFLKLLIEKIVIRVGGGDGNGFGYGLEEKRRQGSELWKEIKKQEIPDLQEVYAIFKKHFELEDEELERIDIELNDDNDIILKPDLSIPYQRINDAVQDINKLASFNDEKNNTINDNITDNISNQEIVKKEKEINVYSVKLKVKIPKTDRKFSISCDLIKKDISIASFNESTIKKKDIVVSSVDISTDKKMRINLIKSKDKK